MDSAGGLADSLAASVEAEMGRLNASLVAQMAAFQERLVADVEDSLAFVQPDLDSVQAHFQARTQA